MNCTTQLNTTMSIGTTLKTPCVWESHLIFLRDSFVKCRITISHHLSNDLNEGLNFQDVVASAGLNLAPMAATYRNTSLRCDVQPRKTASLDGEMQTRMQTTLKSFIIPSLLHHFIFISIVIIIIIEPFYTIIVLLIMIITVAYD